MKVYIYSVHASLEYDLAFMFRSMGLEVVGSFDVGNTERPKIVGSTDQSSTLGFRDSDVVVLHQCEHYPEVMKKAMEVMGRKPVILHAFGQGAFNQHEAVARMCTEGSSGYVVAYARKEYNIYRNLGVPESHVRFIRFGKDLSEYRKFGGWNGRLPICFIPCNSIHQRGDGCGYPILRDLLDCGLPILVSGRDTSEFEGGIGQLTYDGLKAMYRNARCYLSLGTIPAPYTLTLTEALCSGCPVIAYDNGFGIADEDFSGVMICHNVDQIVAAITDFMSSYTGAKEASGYSLTSSDKEFDLMKVSGEWRDLFLDAMSGV